MARQLHDGTGQLLATLAISLSLVQDRAANLARGGREALSESLRLAERCSSDDGALCYVLYPPLLDEGGLTSALRWYTDGFAQRNGMQVELDIPPELARLPREVEMALFRIVQESLTNVQRHSGSHVAGVRLHHQPREVTVEVWEKGVGMPRAEPRDREQAGARHSQYDRASKTIAWICCNSFKSPGHDGSRYRPPPNG